jgi:Tfp pilus assembly protein PilN
MAYATTTYVLLAALAATTAVQMYSTDTQAKQSEANLKFQAEQAEADARAEAGAAQVEAMRIRKQAKMQRAQAIASAAASGIDVDSPTALKIDKDITANAEEDAVLTIMQGKNRGSRLGQQAHASRNEASMARWAGKVNNTATLLSSVSSAASMGANGGAGWKRAAGATGG